MITIAHTFYNQHKMLPLHFEAWRRHPPGLAKYVIVDDGSPVPIYPEQLQNNVRLFQISKNIPWNIAGARNLAFHVAETDWVLCADIDHVVSSEALIQMVNLDFSDANVIYAFQRRRLNGEEGCDAIINLLAHKACFHTIGSYDEDYSGHYGLEETFFGHCIRYHRVKLTRCREIVLTWYPEVGSTKGLMRDKSINKKKFLKKMEELRLGIYGNSGNLRFDWKEIAPEL